MKHLYMLVGGITAVLVSVGIAMGFRWLNSVLGGNTTDNYLFMIIVFLVGSSIGYSYFKGRKK